MNTEKKDIFERVTDQIVKAIEAGADSYRMPWKTSGNFISSPVNAVSKKAYRGINVLILANCTQPAKNVKSALESFTPCRQTIGL